MQSFRSVLWTVGLLLLVLWWSLYDILRIDSRVHKTYHSRRHGHSRIKQLR